MLKGDVPKHVAIILDGNRRWAKRNLKIAKSGHFRGADAVENLLDWCEEFDIKIITLYVLSAENLDRKNEELEYLFDLIHARLEKLYNDTRIHKNKMRVKAIGRIELLPDSIKDVLSRLDNVTKEYDNHFLNIAIAYGGQNELVDAVKKIGDQIKDGSLDSKAVSSGSPKIIENEIENAPYDIWERIRTDLTLTIPDDQIASTSVYRERLYSNQTAVNRISKSGQRYLFHT